MKIPCVAVMMMKMVRKRRWKVWDSVMVIRRPNGQPRPSNVARAKRAKQVVSGRENYFETILT